MPAPTDALPTDALLLIASGCPHCPSVLHSLSEMLKAGQIARLEVINISNQPETAQHYKVRAVPWLRMGPFVLTGLLSRAELTEWLARAQSTAALNDYVRERLDEGDLSSVLAALQHAPQLALALPHWLGDAQADLQVRVGAAAVLEHLEGSDTLATLIEPLTALTHHSDARVRMDAAHALGLTHNAAVRPILEQLRQDPNVDVREVADESLLAL